MRLAIPDIVSPSYFPAIAAVELGLMRDEGLDVQLDLIFPVSAAARALRDGEVEFLAGPAHAALYAFPRWQGAKLLCTMSENTFWFLVVRSDLPIKVGEVTALRNVRIGAAHGPDEGLRQLLAGAGVDLAAAGIEIGPVPRTEKSSTSFGLAAAEALADGRVDAFWANGMGAEVAIRNGTGKVIVDARRDAGEASSFTFAAVMTTDGMIEKQPAQVSAAIRAVVMAQARLRESPDLATQIGERLFPPIEAQLIATLIARDLPYYRPGITETAVANLNVFAQRAGLLDRQVEYGEVVATDFAALWQA